MQAAAASRAARMAAMAAGLILAAGLVSSLAHASESAPSGLHSAYKASEDRLAAGSAGQLRAAADVPVKVVVGPAVRLKAGVSAGRAAVVSADPDDPANGASSGRRGATPTSSIVVSLATLLRAGEQLELSVFSNTPWVLFARATSGQSSTALLLVEVQHGPGRELPTSSEEDSLVPQVTLAPGGAGTLLARSDRVGVTSLRYLVQPETEGQEDEAGPVQLRFDLVSLSG